MIVVKKQLQVALPSLFLIIAVLIAASLLISTGQVAAQETGNANTLVSLLNIPLCADAFAVAPENSAFINPNESIRYGWSGEPNGTARRDFVAFDNFPQPDGSFLSSGNLTIEAAGHWNTTPP